MRPTDDDQCGPPCQTFEVRQGIAPPQSHNYVEVYYRQAFDVQEFHDVVLSHGAIPLPVLQAVVHAWIDARLSKERVR